jgi:hypothetical protein
MVTLKLFLSLMIIYSVNSQLLRLCPSNSICENGGTCIVINDRNISCACSDGFTGTNIKW